MATIKGKWLFNEVVDASTLTKNRAYIINFTSKNESYTRMTINFYDSINYYSLLYGESSAVQKQVCGGYDGFTKLTWNYLDYRYVDFGVNEQTIDDVFYNFIISNAISQDPEIMKIGTITYKDSVIAELEAGKTYTLQIKDKLATDYINIGIDDNIGGNSKYNFTIPSHPSGIFPETICEAEAGMTFEDWVNSEYNTLDLIIYSGGVCAQDGTSYKLFVRYSVSGGSVSKGVLPNDGIGSTTTYIWSR